MFKICPICDFEWHSKDGLNCPICRDYEDSIPKAENEVDEGGAFGTSSKHNNLKTFILLSE